jgi:hypothetical protein
MSGHWLMPILMQLAGSIIFPGLFFFQQPKFGDERDPEGHEKKGD